MAIMNQVNLYMVDFNYNEINQINQNYIGSKIFLIEYGDILNPIQKNNDN